MVVFGDARAGPGCESEMPNGVLEAAMSMTGLDVFDTTAQKTDEWLDQLMEVLGSPDRHEAYRAFRATLHALRDQLTVDEAVHLGAQLPMLMRGFYYEGWDPSNKPAKERHKDQFLARICQELRGGSPVDPEQIARCVFGVLTSRIRCGEIEDVRQTLPSEIRELWP
jgi:uncharacterized protein (DUF2267 family)